VSAAIRPESARFEWQKYKKKIITLYYYIFQIKQITHKYNNKVTCVCRCMCVCVCVCVHQDQKCNKLTSGRVCTTVRIAATAKCRWKRAVVIFFFFELCDACEVGHYGYIRKRNNDDVIYTYVQACSGSYIIFYFQK